MKDAWIEQWLGAPRFQRYVDVCNGDRAQALKLYEWNVALGQALMRDISHFEIALRNAYNETMESRWPGKSHWLLDPDSPAVTPIWRIRRTGQVSNGEPTLTIRIVGQWMGRSESVVATVLLRER